ncbi:MAG: CHRD domain-containing protein [Altererythrobacter ishigakiensis]|nr:CHRD domain-containing protein [Altererythrobacter ishigakiensis]
MKFRTGLIGAVVFAVGMTAAAGAQDEGEFTYVGASLFGENEVGNKGAGEDASGDFSAELDLANGRMCYLLEIEGLDDFAAAHIHEGAKGKNGPPVATLELVGDDGDDVCTDADPELLKKIAKNPARYYVNVHTAAFPAGAVRGQLGE